MNGEFYSNMLSSSAIFHRLIKELKTPTERCQQVGIPSCYHPNKQQLKKLVRILVRIEKLWWGEKNKINLIQ